jgi:succinoglycan biosynthesis transport protein ExoP
MKALTGSSAGFPVPVVEHRRSRVSRFLGVLGRRRLVVLRTTMFFVTVSALVCVLMTRRYTAKTEIQVQKPTAESMESGGTSANASDSEPSSGSLNLQTEATVLQSPALAMKVIQDLRLENAGAFKPHYSLHRALTEMFSPTPPKEVPGASLAASPARRDRLLTQFHEDLDVTIVPGTRVIEVAYSSSDPNLAAQIANHLVESLQDYSLQASSTQTAQQSKWTESQLSDLKAQTDALQEKLITLQKATGVVQVAGDSDGDGRGQAYSSSVDQLQKATASLSEAQTNRILKGAVYEVVKSGNPETIMGLPSNSALAGAAAGMSNDLAVISGLRTREATLNGQMNEMLAKFGPSYPKVDEIKADLASTEQSIKDEVQRMRDRARNEFAVAQQVEASAKQVYDNQRRQADSLNDRSVQYEIVRQEYEQSRDLYEKMLARLKEAGAMQGFRSPNIQVVSAALAPSEPSRPNIPAYLGGSLVGGLLAGFLMAFLVEAVDTRITDVQGLEFLMGQAPFAILPAFSVKKTSWRLSGHNLALPAGESIAALRNPHSPYVEALRVLRTGLLSTKGGPPPQVLLVTSSTEGEGKSTLSANFAVVLAQQGKRVLLIDADLRRPNLHVLFNSTCGVGLSTFLEGKLPIAALSEALLRVDQVPGLDILVAGPTPPFSSELLGSSKMNQALDSWRGLYDFIILDGAPVLPVTDSVVLSSQADATFVVARYELTQQQSLDRSLRTLRAHLGSHRHLGVVLNGVERATDAYYKYYGFTNSKDYEKRLGGGSEIV